MGPGPTPDKSASFVDLFKKAREPPEGKAFIKKAAFKPTSMAGDEFKTWPAKEAPNPRRRREKAGFLAK